MPIGNRLPSRRLDAPFTAAGRTAAMAAAAHLLVAYGATPVDTPLVMAGAFAEQRPVEYVVAALADAPMQRVSSVALADIADEATHIRVALALAAVDQLLALGPRTEELPPGTTLGYGQPCAVAADPVETDAGTALFQRRHDDERRDLDEARQAFDTAAKRHLRAGDVDMANYLSDTGAALGGMRPADVTPAVRAVSQPLEQFMVNTPFMLHDPPLTKPIPPPQPQSRRPPQHFRPTTIRELHTDTCWADLNDWFNRALSWMKAVATGGPPPQRPEVFVRDNCEAFVPDAQGIVWDTRRASEGVIVPLDFTARQDSKWNIPWLRRQWASYPDKEAVSHACDNADILKGQLDLQYVLSPHLSSIADGYANVVQDLKELRNNGCYAWFEHLGMCPTRCNGQGTRPKGDGYRRIASGSCPYNGADAVSINAAIPVHTQARRCRRHDYDGERRCSQSFLC